MPKEDGRSLISISDEQERFRFTLPVTPEQIEIKEGNHTIQHSVFVGR